MATPGFTLASTVRFRWHLTSPSSPSSLFFSSFLFLLTVATAWGDALFLAPVILDPVNPQLIMNKRVVTVPAAFMHVRDNIEELGKVADDTDLLFLKGLLDSPVVTSLVKVSDPYLEIESRPRLSEYLGSPLTFWFFMCQ